MSGPRRIVVLHNTDFDAELHAAGLDASSVKNAAEAVRDGLRAAGMSAELMGLHGLELLEVVRALAADRPDVVFNLCESLAGEARHEPALPAVLDLHGLAYTGTDAVGLALSLFKHRTKDVLHGRGVSTPPHLLIRNAADLERLPLASLDYPWFVKLANEDASVGIIADNVARDAAGLVRRARALFEEFKSPLLAERYVDGREVNVSLLGWGDHVEVMPVHEIDFSAMPADRPRIVSYAAKWDEAHVDYAGTKPVPMRASDDLLGAIRRTARAAWDAIGLRDYGRIDLRVDAAGTPWVIDVNPNCDLSPDAGAARAAQAAGLDYPAFVAKIATSAWRRARGGVVAPVGPA
jgi:D-alanine-D-alanine ligase